MLLTYLGSRRVRWLSGVAVLAAALFGVRAAERAGAPAVMTKLQAAGQAPTTPPAKLGPHPQASLPHLAVEEYALARPAETVFAVYKFAAEHPEILSYVPCYCGCQRGGHRSNEDCFVKARLSNGDVRAWEDHGMVCAVCLDVARTAMQMTASGASVRDIRAEIERTWSPRSTEHTPTPPAPAK